MKKLIFSAFMILIGASVTEARHGAGNGGGGFVCPNSVDNELLDLWEAKNLLKLNIVRSEAAVDEQVASLLSRLKRIDNILGELTEKELTRLPWVDIEPEVEISFPKDANSAFQKPGCRPIGFALYVDETNTLHKDALKIASLPLTDQAALILHEALYKAVRRASETTLSFREVAQDSRFTRWVVGHLVANDLIPQLAGLPEDRYVVCGEDWLWLENNKVYVQRVRGEATKRIGWDHQVGRVLSYIEDKEFVRRFSLIGTLPTDAYTLGYPYDFALESEKSKFPMAPQNGLTMNYSIEVIQTINAHRLEIKKLDAHYIGVCTIAKNPPLPVAIRPKYLASTFKVFTKPQEFGREDSHTITLPPTPAGTMIGSVTSKIDAKAGIFSSDFWAYTIYYPGDGKKALYRTEGAGDKSVLRQRLYSPTPITTSTFQLKSHGSKVVFKLLDLEFLIPQEQ
ncbi:MAG: hypothetical protein AB7F59_11275 [Bdellovibrionales bacterium]